MARFLLATHPITGHVLPALLVARELTARGHDVRWYCGEKFRDRIESTGARFVPYDAAHDYDDSDYDAAFPGRNRLTGLRQIRFDFVNVFVNQTLAQHTDIDRILREFPADAIVADSAIGAASTINERGGPPFAIYSVTCLGLKSRDTAPFGFGLMPSYSSLGRLRNRLLYLLASDVIFREVSKAITQQRTSLGLPPSKFEGPLSSPYLYLEPTVPSFEYPRTDLPPQVHFIGALLSEAPADFEPPSWWAEVVDKKQPVVLVTQGTVATDAKQLIAPTLKALAGEDALVIAAGVKPEASAAIDEVPANARLEAFVPFKPLLPHVDLYVTNGGFGGVHHALANGVPIVCGGTTEDKPEICNRIAYAGAGTNLKTNKPAPEQVHIAVKRVLSEPGYRRKARQLRAELARRDAPAEAAALLERLANTQRPVV
ncbi:MAG: glycosyltransferase [Actinomycetota bacterium]|nr:glycosyltransferase [Actinomycetota bacterium]